MAAILVIVASCALPRLPWGKPLAVTGQHVLKVANDMCLSPQLTGGLGFSPCAFSTTWTIQQDESLRAADGSCLLASTGSGALRVQDACSTTGGDQRLVRYVRGQLLVGRHWCVNDSGRLTRRGRGDCAVFSQARPWRITLGGQEAMSQVHLHVLPEVGVYALSVAVTFFIALAAFAPGTSRGTLTRLGLCASRRNGGVVNVRCFATGVTAQPARVEFRVQ